jgi:hypothetical protein
MTNLDRNTAFSLEGEIALVTGGGTGLGLSKHHSHFEPQKRLAQLITF